MEPLPYKERFWRSNTLAAVKSFAPPVGVQGFVCALPPTGREERRYRI